MTESTAAHNFDVTAYWENRLSGNVSLETVGFLGLGKNYNEWLYRVRGTVFRRIVRALKLDFSACRVLDIGSGTGFYVRIWKQLGVNHIVGLDLTTAAVEHLKQQFPEGTFYKADIGETGVLASSPLFDVISGFDVLFHIVDDSRYRRAIANIHSLLQPGGIFLFSDVFVHNQVLPDRHFVCRSLHQTEQVLNENGFEILDRKPVFVLMGKPVDSRHRLRKLMWGGFQKVVSKSELAGFVAGAILYPVEVTLASMLRESISTELMICRKRKPAQDLSAIMLKRRQLVALCRKSD